MARKEHQPRLFFFLQDRFERVIETVENQKDIIIEDITEKLQEVNKKRPLFFSKKCMYELNFQLQQQIHNIEVESEKQRNAREDAEQKRSKRKNAVETPIRETIEEDDFFFILDLVKHNNFVGGRKKIYMITQRVIILCLLLFLLRKNNNKHDINVFNWIKSVESARFRC